MEQPDLARPGRMTARRLATVMALGGLLAAARQAVPSGTPVDPRAVEVTVEVDAGPLEEVVAVQQAVLVAEARRLGWDRTDPVVNRHLVRALRAAGAEGDDTDLLAEAWDLGLVYTDPVVRERLADRARRALADGVSADPATLQAWLDAHPDRFRRPDRVRFATAFLAADATPERVAALEAQLAEVDPEGALALGDPLLGARPVDTASVERIRGWLGAEAAESLATAPVGAWTGPVASPYGHHWWHVLERTPGEVPPLDLVAAEVEADWRASVGAAQTRERLAALVEAWDVTVVRR